MQTSSPYPKRLFIGTSLLLLLFLLPMLAACGSGNSTGQTLTPQSTTGKPGTSAATPDATPGVLSGMQPCPAAIKDPAYWNPIIPTQSGVSSVASVSCGNLIGNPSLQALVTVRRTDASGMVLDVYVFTNITNATPTKIFQLMGLVKGDAKISGYNTVLTLVQTVFPGIFPDLTRYQAEADQASVNQGQQPWKLSATLVARTLAVSLLNWSLSSSTTLLSGGGAHDVSAVVRVRNSTVVSGAIKVTLSRLEGNTNGGIWEAVAVAVDGMSITSPVQSAVLSSPVSVKGTGDAFEGLIGQVMVLDHLYNTLGKTSATGVVGMGPTSFSTSLYYQSTFPAGIQEGVLVLYAPSNANGSIAAAVMVKVLVNGALERTFAVESVDLAVSPNSIAGKACGSQATFTYTATFHIPAGTAGGTIQFLYTWNNGHASPSASVTVPPGQSTVTYTFTNSGTLYADHTYPGIAEVLVSSPNAVSSPQVKPAGTCS